MTISKEQLLTRKEDIKKDFDTLVKQIDEQELKIKSMKYFVKNTTLFVNLLIMIHYTYLFTGYNCIAILLYILYIF